MGSAEPLEPSVRRSRVPYESRWAPYVRAHEPGQGQLPSGSIRPRGYDSVAPRSPAPANLVIRPARRHHAGDSLLRPLPAAARGGRLLIGRKRPIEPPGDPLD